MCGRCRQVFNAFQSLTRVEETHEPYRADLHEEFPAQGSDNQTLRTFSAIDTATEALGDPLFLRAEPSPLPSAFSASELPPQFAPPPAPPLQPSTGAPATPAVLEEQHEPDEAPSGVPSPAFESSEPAIDLSDERNPLLVEPSAYRQTQYVASSRGWAVGVFVLCVGLLAQAAYAFRTSVVSYYPQLRPAASQMCEYAGCTLSWGRDEAVLKIEASELIEAPGKAGRIQLTAILVNRGKSTQDLPSLELRLTDNANQVVVSRLLHPRDYLGRAIAADEGLVPNTELYVNVNLTLELSNKPPASGYGLIVFYP
jgi:hypothetical protein